MRRGITHGLDTSQASLGIKIGSGTGQIQPQANSLAMNKIKI
jgi:hypothetical protein